MELIDMKMLGLGSKLWDQRCEVMNLWVGRSNC